ncbi:MAG: FAD:protein FMN transferase [Rhodothermales bacterium]
MATRFECALEGSDAPRLQAAGERMLGEVDRWERILSFYDPASELSRVNRDAGQGAVRVSADLFRVLETCAEVVHASAGAFDPTWAPVLRAWGLGGTAKGFAASAQRPSKPGFGSSPSSVGWDGIELDASHRTVRFTHPGLSIDLGGMGKGTALDAVRDLVRDEEWMAGLLDGGLVHGGTSSAVALAGPFRIGIEDPHRQGALLDTVELTDEALSVSAVMGKSVDDVGKQGIRRGHVVDPRTGEPLTADRVAAVVCPDAEFADAWATALVVQPDLSRPPGPVLESAAAPCRIRQWMVFESGPDGTWQRVAGNG